MGGHHKKNLRAEKAKVKLKGAKLPKGLNVTKTDFKVRKITIRDQLKESQYIEGQRQVNLKEILTRLKHHSSNFRLEALRNLRDAISVAHPGVLGHLNEVVQGVASICLDLDKDTRRESFKILSCLLGALPVETVSPFFHVISSYLRCAMTHIQPALQEDALLMLDVLLQHVPRLVASQSNKIFQNFLEMISRVRAEGDRAGRTLTVHMGQKQTTIKWRSKVLLRLQQMLQTLAEHNRRSSGADSAAARSHQTHTFNVKEPQHFSLKRSYAAHHQVCDLSAIFCRSMANTSTTITPAAGGAADEALLLQGYVEHLMPLLLDAWLEVRPQEVTGGAQALLSPDASLTLRVVLGIIENLWNLVEIHQSHVNNNDLSEWFQREYADAFANGFLQNGVFPYQQSVTATPDVSSKRAKKQTPEVGGQFCLQQNICLANLMCRFYAKKLNKQSAKFVILLQYLNAIVDNLAADIAMENYRHLEHALRAYLWHSGAELLLLSSAEKTRALLRATISAFLSHQIPSKDGLAGKVLVLLCDIVQKRSLIEAYGAAEFTEFLVYLPQLLLRPAISEAALVSMSNLGKQKNEIFLQALEKLKVPVIENIQKIQVVGAFNAFEGKKHIMNLFYWTDRQQWSVEQQQQLADKVADNVTDKRIVGYYQFILKEN